MSLSEVRSLASMIQIPAFSYLFFRGGRWKITLTLVHMHFLTHGQR